MQSAIDFFLRHPLQFHGDQTKTPYRVIGQGPPLLLIHGFPAHGLSWRQLVVDLHRNYTCVVIDLAGTGESVWNDETDFSFIAHARRLKHLMHDLGHERYAVAGHDSGGFVARHLAMIAPRNVEKLAIINSEIPNRRPPWIPFFKSLLPLPGSTLTLRMLFRSALFRRSAAGFGGCFWDPRLIEGEFGDLYIQPLIREHRRAAGYARYMGGITWEEVDRFAVDHGEITCPVFLIWGREDPTFPLKHAREMVRQFPHCVGLHVIDRAKLYVHEERPAEVGLALQGFLSRVGFQPANEKEERQAGSLPYGSC